MTAKHRSLMKQEQLTCHPLQNDHVGSTDAKKSWHARDIISRDCNKKPVSYTATNININSTDKHSGWHSMGASNHSAV